MRIRFNQYGEGKFGDYNFFYNHNFSIHRDSINNSYCCYYPEVKPGSVFDIEYSGEKGPDDYVIKFVRYDNIMPFGIGHKAIELLIEKEEVK